ncbi:MAG TPA: sugar phosphate nucleotidyltransferase [Fimbriimonadaceae bacterium]|nr:sugar phosphate nucleotidyltransferase [Fimbriimonadaceae bacterium]
MKGVILAAGKGTRLYPVTRHIPKPLLPLANRPTLHYAFDRLRELGIVDICVVVGEMGPQMMRELGDGSEHGIRLSYVTQTEAKGLAHAVGFARDFVGDGPFALYLGDAIYSEGFQNFARRFAESGCANLNIVKPVEDPTRFGVANVEGERIVKLVEKPKVPESNLAMAGLYFFGPEIWSVLPDLKPSGRGEYEITDAIQMLIDRDHTVLAGVYQGSWFDTGTLDSFLDTSDFLVGDGHVLAGDVAGEVGPGVVVGEGAIVECDRIEDSVILPGARVKVDGTIRHCLLAGDVRANGSIENDVIYGEERRSEMTG